MILDVVDSSLPRIKINDADGDSIKPRLLGDPLPFVPLDKFEALEDDLARGDGEISERA